MEYESPELVVEEAEFSQEFYEVEILPTIIIICEGLFWWLDHQN